MTDYTLIRSNRKTLSLTVKQDLSVVVRAPRRVSQKQADAFVTQNEEWIRRRRSEVEAENRLAVTLSPGEEDALRRKAKEILPRRVQYFSERMGLVPTGIRITGAKTRFGSCSGKNSLNFSWRLMMYPMEAVDYVVVHELAHIRHKNHGKGFYQLIESYLPDYKIRRELLKDPRYRIAEKE